MQRDIDSLWGGGSCTKFRREADEMNVASVCDSQGEKIQELLNIFFLTPEEKWSRMRHSRDILR